MDRPDQPVILDQRPSVAELAILVQLAARNRLQDRERRQRMIRQTITAAGKLR
jgi:hypothetical protein